MGGGWNVFCMHNEHIFTCERQNSMDLMFLCSTTLLFENLISNAMKTGGWVSERYVGRDGICLHESLSEISLMFHCARIL